MKYFYFKPFQPQYYFPKKYKEYPLLTTLFKPYTLIGNIYWWLWRYLPLFKNIFTIDSIDDIFPMGIINNHCGPNAVMAFYRGTPGSEQKVTVFGFDPELDDYFLIKIANSDIAKRNVKNEYKVLKQLEHEDFAPKLLSHVANGKYVLIKTTVFKGVRYSDHRIDSNAAKILDKLTELTIITDRNMQNNLRTCFAHGDFCPWNLMNCHGKAKVFDWEMAGNYPIGYDLFTFIFQTSFLLNPNKKIKTLLDQYRKIIDDYFEHMGINRWELYLIEFAKIKISLESKKETTRLSHSFKKLKQYAEKI